LVLEGFCLLFNSELLLLFLRQSFFLLFFLALSFFLLLAESFFLHLFPKVFFLFLLFHLLSLYIHQVNTSKLLKNIHEPRISLHDLHKSLGISLHKLKCVLEDRILEVRSDSWVLHQLVHCLSSEHTLFSRLFLGLISLAFL
jgi:hypothetical protein